MSKLTDIRNMQEKSISKEKKDSLNFLKKPVNYRIQQSQGGVRSESSKKYQQNQNNNQNNQQMLQQKQQNLYRQKVDLEKLDQFDQSQYQSQNNENLVNNKRDSDLLKKNKNYQQQINELANYQNVTPQWRRERSCTNQNQRESEGGQSQNQNQQVFLSHIFVNNAETIKEKINQNKIRNNNVSSAQHQKRQKIVALPNHQSDLKQKSSNDLSLQERIKNQNQNHEYNQGLENSFNPAFQMHQKKKEIQKNLPQNQIKNNYNEQFDQSTEFIDINRFTFQKTEEEENNLQDFSPEKNNQSLQRVVSPFQLINANNNYKQFGDEFDSSLQQMPIDVIPTFGIQNQQIQRPDSSYKSYRKSAQGNKRNDFKEQSQDQALLSDQQEFNIKKSVTQVQYQTNNSNNPQNTKNQDNSKQLNFNLQSYIFPWQNQKVQLRNHNNNQQYSVIGNTQNQQNPQAVQANRQQRSVSQYQHPKSDLLETSPKSKQGIQQQQEINFQHSVQERAISLNKEFRIKNQKAATAIGGVREKTQYSNNNQSQQQNLYNSEFPKEFFQNGVSVKKVKKMLINYKQNPLQSQQPFQEQINQINNNVKFSQEQINITEELPSQYLFHNIQYNSQLPRKPHSDKKFNYE